LVNFKGDEVEHEFVNATLSREVRASFNVKDTDYIELPGNGLSLKELFVPLLRDWGTCLDLELYEEALIHFLGGQQHVIRPVEILVDGKRVGQQPLKLLSPDVSFCVTAINNGQDQYELQLRRFLKHTSLRTIQWVYVGRTLGTFKTIRS